MTKSEQLSEIKRRMESNEALPLRKGATQLVFGEGNPNSQVYFLGEAPGFYEDREGKPFVGRAGVLLSKLIEGIGLSREEVYISNVVRFRPPQNRDPDQDEIDAFAPYVDKEIEVIDPKVIVTLGRFSMAKFFSDKRISTVHGQIYKVKWQGHSRLVVPMYHPAAALRNGSLLNTLKEDFDMIKKALNENVIEEENEKNIEKESTDKSQLKLFTP